MSKTSGTNKAYNIAYKLINNIMVRTDVPEEKEGCDWIKRTILLLLILLILPTYSFGGTISGYYTPGGYYGGHSGYYEWIDYCPQCHHYNCLANYHKGVNEITCVLCDADYDGCTGGDKHAGGAWAWLIPYVPKVEKVEPEPNEPPVIVKTPLEQMRDIYYNNKII